VSLESKVATEHHRPGIEALSRLRYLTNFKFASSPSAISQSELELVSLSMCLMPRLRFVGRNLLFTPEKCQIFSSLRTCYHNTQALQLHAQHQQAPALEEFYAHSDFWTADTVRLLPNLKRLHVIRDNHHIPDTLMQLSLYHNHSLQTVRAFTPNLRQLSLSDCNLSGVPYGGVLALCPNLDELHLLDCVLVPSNVALDDGICQRSVLRVLTLRCKQGVRVDGVVSRLLQAPLLQKVQISVAEVPLAEVRQLVQQVCHGRILQMVRVLSLEGENCELLARTSRAFLPEAVDVA
jgi:hypothetical protein